MAEIKQEVRLYLVDCACDECHEGKMRSTGTCYTTNPPLYPHSCNKCGHVEMYDKIYPFQQVEPLETF